MALKEAVDKPQAESLAHTMRTGRRAGIPPLENGDRLTRREFERRYENMPHVIKVELVEGIVHMPSPVRYDTHGRPHMLVNTWLGVYVAATPGVGAADNSTVCLDAENEVQPDALLRLEQGGRSHLAENGFVEGSPELVVEIAGTSAAYDLHDKLRAYRRNEVQEYAVYQVLDEKVDWFELLEGEYVSLPADDRGVVDSRVFPGLRLAVPALLAGDLAAVLAELQKGLASAEYLAFAERLSNKP